MNYEINETGKNLAATVKLRDVRLSFPALFTAKDYNGDGNFKFSAVLLMDKKSEAGKACKGAVDALLKHPKGFAGKFLSPDKIALHDGAEKDDLDGYGPEVYFLNAKNDKRPAVVDRDKTPLVESDGRPYAGCYVNAVVRFWCQDNQYGKRINCALQAVQFLRDGEPFGSGSVDVDDLFDDESEGLL